MKQIFWNKLGVFFSLAFCLGTIFTATAQAAKETEPAVSSNLTSVSLPANALRVLPQNVPGEVKQTLENIIAAGNGQIRQGATEVLVWTGTGYKKANATTIINRLTDTLKVAGWKYEIGAQEQEVTVFSVVKDSGTRRAILGFYGITKDALVFAWTELLAANSSADNRTLAAKSESTATSPTHPPINTAAKVLTMDKNVKFINVMGNEMPALPAFPALTPKAGKVRGYVKDWSGKPLAGAALGVRSTLIGGAYSGAQGITDATGYYEFMIPTGVAHFYNAGYTIDFGEGRAALSLHPADGKLDSFASPDGAVENFVLLPYGITNRDNLSENPHLASTFYGASIYLGYSAREANDNAAPAGNLIENSIIEITLTPVGTMLDGSAGKSFVIRKTADFGTGFKLHNIPIGSYKISARLANGKPLKLSLNKPRDSVFGMTPIETTGEAVVTFYPNGAKASMVAPAYGNWNSVELRLERQ